MAVISLNDFQFHSYITEGKKVSFSGKRFYRGEKEQLLTGWW